MLLLLLLLMLLLLLLMLLAPTPSPPACTSTRIKTTLSPISFCCCYRRRHPLLCSDSRSQPNHPSSGRI